MSASLPARRPGRRVTRVIPVLIRALSLAAALGLTYSRLGRPPEVLQWLPPWAEVGALACGMTAVIVAGGIDLSAGALVALCSIVLGLTAQRLGWPIGLACVLAVCAGAAGGALNGTLVSWGVAPLAATLATMACYSGLAQAFSGGTPMTGFPARFTRLGQGVFLGLQPSLWLFMASALAWAVLLHVSRFGRSLFAIGDNPIAARYAALPVPRRLWWLYTFQGLLAGLVAVSSTSRTGKALPGAGHPWVLLAIASVVLGGTRLTGGAGGILRTLIGLAILAHLDIGLGLLGDVIVRLPGTPLKLVLDEHGRLVVIVPFVITVAILNERLSAWQ